MIKFKKVIVLGVPFTVHVLPQSQICEMLGHVPSPEGNPVGFCDDLEDRIVLAKELTGKALKKTFIHEWAHAVPGSNGLNQTLDPVVAECVSVSFANALIELLSQKEVRKFLLG
jgi:hypothetical protein